MRLRFLGLFVCQSFQPKLVSFYEIKSRETRAEPREPRVKSRANSSNLITHFKRDICSFADCKKVIIYHPFVIVRTELI